MGDLLIGELVVLLSAAVAAGGAIVTYYVSSRASTRRWFKRLPLHAIGEFPDQATGVIEGAVELHPDEHALVAPFSGHACVGYQLLIETNVDWLADGWLLVHSEAACCQFVVRSGTTSARIDASTEIVVIAEQHIWNANEGSDDRITQLLQARNLLEERPLTQPLRVLEEVICIGDPVAVAGRGERAADPLGENDPLYRDTPTRLVMAADDAKHPLLIATPPKRATAVRERSRRAK